MQQANDVGDMERRRQRLPRRARAGFDRRHVRSAASRARRACHRLVGQPPEILDQRELQHARPRPQLADRQRRDALIAVQEDAELVTIDAAVAVAHQFDGHRVDPRFARVLARDASVGSCR